MNLYAIDTYELKLCRECGRAEVVAAENLEQVKTILRAYYHPVPSPFTIPNGKEDDPWWVETKSNEDKERQEKHQTQLAYFEKNIDEVLASAIVIPISEITSPRMIAPRLLGYEIESLNRLTFDPTP